MKTKFSLLVSISKMQLFKVLFILIVCLAFTACSDSKKGPQTPATSQELSKILDLENFALMPDAVTPRQKGLASLSYIVATDMNSAFSFHQKYLLDNKWVELAGSYVLDEQAAAYKKKNNIP